MKRWIVTALAAAFGAVAMAPNGVARADSVADFYKGKTVTLVIGYGPGGGYDVFGRLIARFIGNHIPGNPNVVVQNMPGAGSLKATNYLYNVAPKDGTVIGMFARDMPQLAILGTNKGVHFDPLKFTWLGSSNDFSDDAYLLMVRGDSPVTTYEQAIKPDSPPIVLAATGQGATGSDIPILLRDAMGLKFKIVAGYPDNGAIFLSIERGEVQGRMVDLSSIRSLKPNWVGPNSPMKFLLQMARDTRHPDFPNVPTARELVKDPKALALIKFAEGSYKIARPFVAPPGLPPDRAKALQDAFEATNKDPALLAEADKLRVAVAPLTAEQARKVVAEDIAGASPDVLDYMRKLHAGN
ncbi:MAG TPA: tripartite tricarboxylate transporter substrate-binding protein [Xanthobacteraceae bacterium]|jgi:tripartite-type tricarboxylate transporter receptor subunit TctC|nr:tripartite tricarboxylate transporter substrate-binding protein [Xanthobacteraceae bacterium]